MKNLTAILIAIAIVIGCALIAAAIYYGLTYDKRTYMESCNDSLEGCEFQFGVRRR